MSIVASQQAAVHAWETSTNLADFDHFSLILLKIFNIILNFMLAIMNDQIRSAIWDWFRSCSFNFRLSHCLWYFSLDGWSSIGVSKLSYFDLNYSSASFPSMWLSKTLISFLIWISEIKDSLKDVIYVFILLINTGIDKNKFLFFVLKKYQSIHQFFNMYYVSL